MCTCLTDLFKGNLPCVPVHVSCHVKARAVHLQTLGHDLWFNLHIFRIITPLVHRVIILWQETAYRLCVCFRSKVTLMLWDQHLATMTPFCKTTAERARFHSFFHALSCHFSPLSLDLFYQVYPLQDFRTPQFNNRQCFLLLFPPSVQFRLFNLCYSSNQSGWLF